MKTNSMIGLALAICASCNPESKPTTPQAETVVEGQGQSGVRDDESQQNIVQIAVSSPDHKTLVAALKAAEYVDALSNAGPFTVFAPTDAAFAKLPAGTVEDLVKPGNRDKLREILEYHVYVGVIRENMIRSGMTLNQVNGRNVTVGKDQQKLSVNGSAVVGIVPASNGIIYIIDQVLLPPPQ